MLSPLTLCAAKLTLMSSDTWRKRCTSFLPQNHSIECTNTLLLHISCNTFPSQTCTDWKCYLSKHRQITIIPTSSSSNGCVTKPSPGECNNSTTVIIKHHQSVFASLQTVCSDRNGGWGKGEENIPWTFRKVNSWFTRITARLHHTHTHTHTHTGYEFTTPFTIRVLFQVFYLFF